MSEPRASQAQAEYLTVSQAAARLGISERTVQRRCKSGQLSARLVTDEDGAQWLIDPATVTTGDDIGADTADKVPTHSKPPFQSQNDALRPDKVTTGATAALLAEKDARINDLRAQVEAWRLQAEAANRTAAETSAALREALKALPKALTDGSTPTVENIGRENAPQAPIIPSGDKTTTATKQSPQRGAKPRKLTAWQRIGARILGIR
jgi:excisionase family DNA binding protein